LTDDWGSSVNPQRFHLIFATKATYSGMKRTLSCLSIVSSIFLALLLVATLPKCQVKPGKQPSTEPKDMLTAAEKKTLDSIGFDKAIVNSIKLKLNSSFNIMATENRSGKDIPKNMLPVMIYFKAEKSMNTAFLEEMKGNNSGRGYNIYSIDQGDGKLTIVVSKL
jgi:hypothetical protein